MNLLPAVTPVRLAVLTLAALAAGCTSYGDGFFSGDKVDYRSSAASAKPLDVPPDLTQLARESRYQPQGGVVSAANAGSPTALAAANASAAAAAAATPTVAVASQGAVKVEREGQQRWLAVKQTPEQLWPQVKAFWEQRGFTLEVENAQVGVMETQWSENRARLPADVVRNTLGKMLGNIFDSGERDRYRTRIERTPAGSEIYISHRGIEETFAGERKESTVWRARPNDPQLEAEFLSKLMVALGSKDEQARVAVAAAVPASAATAGADAGKARVVSGSSATSLVVDEPFDRAWRRVGLALDRGGFTVEDRDRTAGVYYVRYVDPKSVGKEEPGWWSRLLGNSSNPGAALRYRIAVKGSGDKTNVSVQTTTGAPEVGENAQRIVALLIGELK